MRAKGKKTKERGVWEVLPPGITGVETRWCFDGKRELTNGGGQVIGKFPSQKSDVPVWWEYRLERDYVFLLEFDPEVVTFESQPFRIRFEHDGKVRRYSTDFRVVRKTGTTFVEVKPEEKLEKYEPLFRAVRPIFREGMKCEFEVVTDRTIRVQPRLDNVKLLHRYARTEIDDGHILHCMRFFGDKPEASLGEFESWLSGHGVGKNILYGLLYRKIVAIDISKPIAMDSLVRFTGVPTIVREVA